MYCTTGGTGAKMTESGSEVRIGLIPNWTGSEGQIPAGLSSCGVRTSRCSPYNMGSEHTINYSKTNIHYGEEVHEHVW